MTDKDLKLIQEMRTAADSHQRNGEVRTADLLKRAADRLVELARKELVIGYANPAPHAAAPMVPSGQYGRFCTAHGAISGYECEQCRVDSADGGSHG